MKVKVDADLCIGCGLCTETCPDVFEMDEDQGVAKVKVEEVPEDAQDCVRQAAEDCPGDAIQIEE